MIKTRTPPGVFYAGAQRRSPAESSSSTPSAVTSPPPRTDNLVACGVTEAQPGSHAVGDRCGYGRVSNPEPLPFEPTDRGDATTTSEGAAPRRRPGGQDRGRCLPGWFQGHSTDPERDEHPASRAGHRRAATRTRPRRPNHHHTEVEAPHARPTERYGVAWGWVAPHPHSSRRAFGGRAGDAAGDISRSPCQDHRIVAAPDE